MILENIGRYLLTICPLSPNIWCEMSDNNLRGMLLLPDAKRMPGCDEAFLLPRCPMASSGFTVSSCSL